MLSAIIIKELVLEAIAVITAFAPELPGVPVVVTPVVYSLPPPCVPFDVVENLKGCPELELSD